MRPAYRIWQFTHMLLDRPPEQDLDRAAQILGDDLFALFIQLKPSEQSHALRVMKKLESEGSRVDDLLKAALLHDIGKIYYPLNLLERSWIVVCKKWSNGRFEEVGFVQPERIGNINRFGRSRIVAVYHPHWGAELIRQHGASEKTTWLVEQHQNGTESNQDREDVRMLHLLQNADHQS